MIASFNEYKAKTNTFKGRKMFSATTNFTIYNSDMQNSFKTLCTFFSQITYITEGCAIIIAGNTDLDAQPEDSFFYLKVPFTDISNERKMNAEVHIRLSNTEPLKVGNKVFKSAYDWELTEKDLEKAARELGETNQKKEACLRKLKKKLSDDSSYIYRQDDFYLLRFLRFRKYDVAKAFRNIKFLYNTSKKYPDFFTIPPDLKSTQELNFFTCLPYTDEEGRIILWMKLNRWNLQEKSFEEIIQATVNVFDIISMNPTCQVHGMIHIYDLGGITLRHISEFLWKGRLWGGIPLTQNGYPWRIKKLLVLNTNRLVRLLYNIARPVMPTKIAERFVFLGSDVDELHQYVNPVLLPKSLNGSLEEEECDMSQHVLNNLSYIKYERSFLFPSKN